MHQPTTGDGENVSQQQLQKLQRQMKLLRSQTRHSDEVAQDVFVRDLHRVAMQTLTDGVLYAAGWDGNESSNAVMARHAPGWERCLQTRSLQSKLRMSESSSIPFSSSNAVSSSNTVPPGIRFSSTNAVSSSCSVSSWMPECTIHIVPSLSGCAARGHSR
jgi:hypothetical protein